MQRLIRSLGYTPDAFVLDDECPPDYLEEPANDNDRRTVTRLAYETSPYNNVCSTIARRIKVRLPRVTFIDGPYREAAA